MQMGTPVSLNQRQLEGLRGLCRGQPLPSVLTDGGYFSPIERQAYRRLADRAVFFVWSDAIRVGHRAILFVGPSGAGKTSVVRAIANSQSDSTVLGDDNVGLVARREKIYAFEVSRSKASVLLPGIKKLSIKTAA